MLAQMLPHTLSLNLNDYLINCIYRQLNNYTVPRYIVKSGVKHHNRNPLNK